MYARKASIALKSYLNLIIFKVKERIRRARKEMHHLRKHINNHG